MKRLITQTAREHLNWITGTYGIGEEVCKWTRSITDNALKPKRPLSEVPLQQVLDEMESLAQSELSELSDLAASVRKFRGGDWLTRLKQVRVVAMRRTFPVKHRVSTECFYGLSDKSLLIDVKTVYEIDLGAETVTFQAFLSYSASSPEAVAAINEAEEWK